MKKYTFIFAAVAAILLAGCQKEEFSAPSAKQEDGKVVLKATVNQTRSTVSEDGLFAWAEDDVIGVMTDKGTFTPFNLTDGSGTYKATFTSVESGVKVEKLAVFPAEIGKSLSDKSLTVTLPNSYPYIADRTNSPMLAVLPEGDGQPAGVEFKHLCGLLAVTYNHVPQGDPQGAKYFYVRSENQYVYGTFKVSDYTADNAAVKANDIDKTANPNAYSSIRIVIPDGATFEGPTTFYVPLPVGAYDSLTVGFLDSDNFFLEETRRGYKDVVVERADMRTTSFDNLAWDITYDYRGVFDNREDGRDVLRFWNIPGKWQYTTVMHAELNGVYYGGDILKVIDQRVADLKASTSSKSYEGNYRINFSPFPPKQTFHVVAFQVDDEFNCTGSYIHRSWTPKEKESCSEGFNKWLGTWLATGKDEAGNDSSYVLTITNKSNDELFAIEGWAHSSSGQKLQAWYDAATGGLVIKTYPFNYQTTKDADGITYHRKFGYFGATAKGFQHANTTLCTGTIDETGTTATLEGYTYYTNSPFVTMGLFYSAYEKNPTSGANRGWYVKEAKTLIHFPVTLSKVEVD
ncbi:MAG: lipoprotein [Bacteroidales bacterium]|nr:lipoprotein [Bacteroidales bacterium]